jgi:hypothetical protein
MQVWQRLSIRTALGYALLVGKVARATLLRICTGCFLPAFRWSQPFQEPQQQNSSLDKFEMLSELRLDYYGAQFREALENTRK